MQEHESLQNSRRRKKQGITFADMVMEYDRILREGGRLFRDEYNESEHHDDDDGDCNVHNLS
jgi:hypothetical protein